MSIIHDALKKAQAKLQSKKEPPAASQPPAPQAPLNPQAAEPSHDINPYLQYTQQPQPAPHPERPYGDPNPVPPQAPLQPGAPKTGESKTPRDNSRIVFLSLMLCGLVAIFSTLYKQQIAKVVDIDLPAVKFPAFPKSDNAPAKPKRQPSPDGITISGVMMQNNTRLVIINDAVYKQGDTVNGLKILEIHADRIVVEDNTGVIKDLKVK